MIIQDCIFLHPREIAYNILKIALLRIKEEHGIECFQSQSQCEYVMSGILDVLYEMPDANFTLPTEAWKALSAQSGGI